MNRYSRYHHRVRIDGVGHASDGTSAHAGISNQAAERVAQTMQALATASRVRLLAQLRDGPRTVSELANGAEMNQSAVSQQLRVLRHLGLVVGHRDGRHVHYSVHDQHVAKLLDEAIGHAEHIELGLADHPGKP
jgi:DNA-binding transcriptional ArsR family regulator